VKDPNSILLFVQFAFVIYIAIRIVEKLYNAYIKYRPYLSRFFTRLIRRIGNKE